MQNSEYILVTGGAGFIGSHIVVELVNEGYQPLIIDNFSNALPSVIKNIESITNKEIPYIKADLLNKQDLFKVFDDYKIKGVMHFAGLKAVSESINYPLNYYENNVTGSINLLSAMERAGVDNIVFSSSASVYGVPKHFPINESHSLLPIHPYGKSKLMVEQIIDSINKTNGLKAVILRYFNPVGSHKSGLIGDNPLVLNNIMPIILAVASGEKERLSIFGNDYDTVDGTCVRDYIHITDLVRGHIAALNFLSSNSGVHKFNLGAGKGVSVLELINFFQEVCNIKINYNFLPRRSGDVAKLFADASFAKEQLSWKTNFDFKDMCLDSWHFKKKASQK